MRPGTFRHMRSATWSGASVTRDGLQEDSAMCLPENQHPKLDDSDTIHCLAGNVPSRTTAGLNQAIIDCGHILPKGAAPPRGSIAKGMEVREALASLDGSPLAGGLAPSPNLRQNAPAAGAFHFFAPTTSSPSNPPGRKRSMPDISVFDDFRSRDTYQVDRQSLAGFDGEAATPSSFLVGSCGTGSSSIGQTVEAFVQQCFPVTTSFVSASPAPAMEQAHAEDALSSDGEPMDITMENQENVPLPADMQVPPTTPGTQTVVAMSERAPLHDLALEVPVEYQDYPYSDSESDDDEIDMQGPNPADELAERISNNVDGRYDFEIYCDP